MLLHVPALTGDHDARVRRMTAIHGGGGRRGNRGGSGGGGSGGSGAADGAPAVKLRRCLSLLYCATFTSCAVVAVKTFASFDDGSDDPETAKRFAYDATVVFGKGGHGTAVGVAAAWVAVVLAGAPLFAAAHVRQLYHDDKLHDGPTQRKFGHV